jgi:hypothetical protein
LLTIKDTAHKLDTDQKGVDPYFKFTSEVKTDQSPRIPVTKNPQEVKIKCQVNLNKLFGSDQPMPTGKENKKTNLKENYAANEPAGIKLPGKFSQTSKGIPIFIKPSKVPPKAPKNEQNVKYIV